MTRKETLWRVTVLCEGTKPNFNPQNASPKRPPKIVRRSIRVLLEAADSDQAMEAARSYADENAAPDVRWACFTAMVAERFLLPTEI